MDEQGAWIAGGTVVFTLVIILFSVVATVVPLVLVFRWIAKMNGANQQLLMTGWPAQARVVQMGPTGMTINGAPQMNLVVEVYPPAMPGYRGAPVPFTTTVQALVPVYAMASVQPGATVPVRFDPAMPSKVAVDFRAMGFV
jgi:hypothetical protein